MGAKASTATPAVVGSLRGSTATKYHGCSVRTTWRLAQNTSINVQLRYVSLQAVRRTTLTRLRWATGENRAKEAPGLRPGLRKAQYHGRF
ncbi:unnamed protein product [Nesidiocoris tenuis]|uniref:Uncharacterized protein n=1 Tax=Nesidiocoris tenuis TaxID=355587 RepID=A0A6H5HNA5_9HEMI|nr:unnamed protein product [Nesidiocoris tenuis]